MPLTRLAHGFTVPLRFSGIDPIAAVGKIMSRLFP